MKFQLALLLVVVLCVSLPSAVFAQPLLSAVQSGEASPAAPTAEAEAVKKSWEGPVFGFGLGLGLAQATLQSQGESEDSPIGSGLPVQIRFGYGLSERTVLYGSVITARILSGEFAGEWTGASGLVGVMVRGSRYSQDYWFSSLGASFQGDPRALEARGGYGYEIHPGLSVEGASSIGYVSFGYESVIGFQLDLTFNYHFY